MKKNVVVRKTLKMFAIIEEKSGGNGLAIIGVVVGEVNNACVLARAYSDVSQNVVYVCGYYPMFMFSNGYDIEVSDFAATDETIHDLAQIAYAKLVS